MAHPLHQGTTGLDEGSEMTPKNGHQPDTFIQIGSGHTVPLEF